MTDSNSGPNAQNIIDAFRASGYLMEQEVALELEKEGFHVETGRAYTDIDEGKSREIDVHAVHGLYHNEELKINFYLN